MKSLSLIFLLIFTTHLFAQTGIKGKVVDEEGRGLEMVLVAVKGSSLSAYTNSKGIFQLSGIPPGEQQLVFMLGGYLRQERNMTAGKAESGNLRIVMRPESTALEEVVVTGTLKESGKSESPVNVDIVTARLLRRTLVPNLFEATALVNGVKPQINCNVCSTGDIHINGLEGPYTLILIDGMPIVSGLSSVYGLMGIPTSLMDRLEIAKGPASALYGSEAMGGTINLITKFPDHAPRFSVDYSATSYKEHNLDLGLRLKTGKRTNWLFGANTFYFDEVIDRNQDGFTDLTLQKRLSFFSKMNVSREDQKEFSVAARYVYEGRWGGQTNWNSGFRGGDSIYGESIYLNRVELISKYQWPVREKIYSQLSYNFHDQNSVYGTNWFLAKQSTAFFQTYWNRQLNSRNDFIAGVAYKSIWYDDNTVVTSDRSGMLNNPDLSHLVGLFAQNEYTIDSLSKHKILFGLRADYHNVYKLVSSPRIAYKWSPDYRWIFRANLGTGFRVVNVFTEDHAALTGAREVVFTEQIEPERSLNGSLNLVHKMPVGTSRYVNWEAGLFYYHFYNKIVADYDSDPNKVIYNNLSGYAYSRGFNAQASLAGTTDFKFTLGLTYANVQNIEEDSAGIERRYWQLQSPRWSFNYVLSYTLPRIELKLDLTGNIYGPQRLPVLPNDFRPEYSPWYCLANIQASKSFKRWELYAGVKNLLNFVPLYPIMRPHDPFDKNVADPVQNPHGYTFDTGYNYAPLQGIRFYMGLRCTLF